MATESNDVWQAVKSGTVVQVPTAVLCQILGVSDVHLGKLAKAGHVQKVEQGQFDLWASVRSYVEFLTKKAESGRKAPQRHTLVLAEAKIEESRERRERMALLNAEARRELVPVKEILMALGTVCASMRERILSSDLSDAEKDLLMGDLKALLESEAFTHERSNGSGSAGDRPVLRTSAKDDLSEVV